MHYDVYTDGACSGNPGPGGFGVVLISDEAPTKAITVSMYEAKSTNNQMELSAAIVGLQLLQNFVKGDYTVTMYTDSKYVKDGITSWIQNWKRRGWRKSDNKPVLNKELWQVLDKLNNDLHVEWCWVKGHASNRFNNMADKLATEAISNKQGVNTCVNI